MRDLSDRAVPRLLILALVTALAPGASSAQTREVVAKEIAVGPSEASLRLEFPDGDLEVSIRDGIVEIDGDEVGTVNPADALASAWRELLGSAVTMEDGSLARELADWSPPASLDGADQVLGERIDRALEEALRTDVTPDPGQQANVEGDELVRSLLSRADRLGDLGDVLEGADLSNMFLRIGEDVHVREGEELGATLVAIDADVEIEGTVGGDVIVVDGTLTIREEGRVTGDVRLINSRLMSDEGTVEGTVSELTSSGEPGEAQRSQLRDELREELRQELRAEAATDQQSHESGGWSFLRPFRAIGHGFTGILVDIMNVVVGALLGWLLVYLAGDNLEVVAETARRSTGRSALVGLAGTFLILPVWLLGALALILTIVGIFALPFWLVLFPIAVAVAVGLGFYGVASGIGDWLAKWRHPLVQWVRSSNAYTLVTGGLVALAAPFVLANVAEMSLFLGLIENLLLVLGWFLLAAAGLVGFGAVLLTRAGRRPGFYWNDPPDEDPGSWSGRPSGSSPSSGGSDWFGPPGRGGAGQGPEQPTSGP